MMTLPSLAALQIPGLEFFGDNPVVTIVLVAVLALASIVMLFASRYKRCPSNRVLVVYGKVERGQAAKVYSGGGAFIWPVIQQFAFLDLTPLQIDIELMDALSLENIRVKVPSVVTVAIGETEEYQQNAALRLLTLRGGEVQDLAANIIFGQMRQVIASMAITEINRDREGFRGNIEHALEPELLKIGLKLINVNIKDISDESGYIEAIGQKAGAMAVQQARGDVAEQVKLGEIAVAEANQEKDIQVAEADRERAIGVAAAGRDQAVELADLERQTAVAEQRAEYERDTEIAQADQSRRVAVAAANADAVTGETQSQAQIAAAEAELQVRRSEAFELGETRKRVAEAAVEEAENRAQAKAAIADAERIEAERRAALEAPAKADKARQIVKAEAEGESRKIEALADAAALYARLEAEARGEFETLSRKADGLKRIVDACGGADEAYRLLMLEHLDHLADKAAEAVQNIKFDKVVMWGGGNGGAGAGVSSFVADVMGSLPPALHTMMNIGGVKIADGLFEIVDDEDEEEEARGSNRGGAAGEPAKPASKPRARAAAPKARRAATQKAERSATSKVRETADEKTEGAAEAAVPPPPMIPPDEEGA